MKKLYFIIFSFLLANITFSQGTVKILNSAKEDVTNGISYFNSNGINEPLLGDIFYLTNTSDQPITINYSREVISISNNNFLIQFCEAESAGGFPGYCFNTEGAYWICPSSPIVLQPEDTTNFKPQVNTGEEAGTAVVKYFILDADENQIADITIDVDNNFTASIEKQEELVYSVYPNPATNVITVDSNTKGNATAVFIDALGKEVKRVLLNEKNTKVNISELKRGVYFVNIYVGEQQRSITKRLVKQ
ncbi:MAG: T9SS type A sorting domain-containing protein [Brumimicrobium sp.]